MACGGDESAGNDGPDTMDPPGRGGTETTVAPMGPLTEDTAFLRVDMIVTDSTVTMARTNRATIEKGTQRPQPVMIGNFLLMAKAGNTIVESHLVRHTPAVFSENVDENRNFVDSEINELTESLSTAFVVVIDRPRA